MKHHEKYEMSQPAAQNPQPPTQSSAGINGLDPDRGTLNLGLAGAADGQQQQQSSAGVSLGQADNPNGLHDFIDLFPYTSDASLYSHPTSDRLCLDPPTMYLELAFYFVFMTAKTTWNLPVRAMNYLFQSMWLLLGLAYGLGKRRHQLRQGYEWNTAPVAGIGLDRHENELFAGYALRPALTLETAAKRSGSNYNILYHPSCSRKNCRFVYHDITRREEFDRAGDVCKGCSKPFVEDNKRSHLVEFPRQSLLTELERVLSMPGVERLCFSYQSRRTGDTINKVYREQWDGASWPALAPDGRIIDETQVDVIHLNLSTDYYEPNYSNRAQPASIGPISAQIANLPNALRGRMQMNLLLGVTPGASNETSYMQYD